MKGNKAIIKNLAIMLYKTINKKNINITNEIYDIIFDLNETSEIEIAIKIANKIYTIFTEIEINDSRAWGKEDDVGGRDIESGHKSFTFNNFELHLDGVSIEHDWIIIDELLINKKL